MSKSCSHCAHTLPADAKFCTRCGQACSSPPVAAPITCPACLSALKPGASFCTQCGKSLHTAVVASDDFASTETSSASSQQQHTPQQPAKPDYAQTWEPLPAAASSASTRWVIAGLTLICLSVVAGLGGWYWHTHHKPQDDFASATNNTLASKEESLVSPEELPQASATVSSKVDAPAAEAVAEITNRKLPEAVINDPPIVSNKPANTHKKVHTSADDEESDEEFFDEVDTKATLRKAEQALKRGQGQRAAELAQDVLANDPNNRRARQILIEARLPKY